MPSSPSSVHLRIDGRPVDVPAGTTILEAARQLGIDIPTLCYHEALKPYGACRMCLVEVRAGTARGSAWVAACVFPVREGIEVVTATPEIEEIRRNLLELLLARCPGSPRVRALAARFGVRDTPYRPRDHTCILCGLCVRACEEIVGARAIDFACRGRALEVKPPLAAPSAACIGCGTCLTVCPTDAVKLAEISSVPYEHPADETRPAQRCRVCSAHPRRDTYPETYEDWFP